MADELSRTFLGSGPGRVRRVDGDGRVLTAWDPTTYANTVTDGAYTFTDCLVMQPSTLVAGRVLLYITPGGPVILGNTYKRVTAAPNPDVPGGGGSNPSDPGGGGPTPARRRRDRPGSGDAAVDADLPGRHRVSDDRRRRADTPQNLTNLASAVSGVGVRLHRVDDHVGDVGGLHRQVDITIRGITMGLGGS
jgi:hypothetical protein